MMSRQDVTMRFPLHQQTGPTLGDLTCAHVPPERHRGEIPLSWMLIRFHER